MSPISLYFRLSNNVSFSSTTDEVAPIRAIPDKDTNKEFFKVEPGNIVYHTSNEECVIHIRRDPLGKL